MLTAIIDRLQAGLPHRTSELVVIALARCQPPNLALGRSILKTALALSLKPNSGDNLRINAMACACRAVLVHGVTLDQDMQHRESVLRLLLTIISRERVPAARALAACTLWSILREVENVAAAVRLGEWPIDVLYACAKSETGGLSHPTLLEYILSSIWILVYDDFFLDSFARQGGVKFLCAIARSIVGEKNYQKRPKSPRFVSF